MTDLPALMADLERHLGDPHDPDGRMTYRRVLELDEREEYPHEFVDLLACWGLYDWIVPAENGGRAVDVQDGFNLYRLVARRDPTAATAMVLTSLSYMPVWVAGTPEQRQHFADVIRRGGKLAWGLSERQHGSDVLANETTARRTTGGWLLDGEKWTIGNATVADVVMVFARTSDKGGPGGYSIFAVEKDAVPAEQREHLPDEPLHGLRGLDMSGVRLLNCFVPDTALVGRAGQGLETALKSSQLARVAIASIAMSCVDTALRTTLDFATQRVIFGGTVSEVPYSQRQLAESYADLLVADALTTGAVRSLQVSPDQASIWSSVVKYFVPTFLEETLGRLATVLGARYYLRSHPRHGIFQKVLRDFAISNFADGNTVVNLKNIALQLEKLLANAVGQDPALVAGAVERTHALFDPAHPMEPYQPAEQQLFSRGVDDPVLALRSAVDELHRAAEAAGGRDAARLAAAADTAGEIAGELDRIAEEHRKLVADLGKAAGQSAELYDLAKQYTYVSAAAAVVHLHLRGHDSVDPALRSPAVLLVCLERLLKRFHPTRRVTGPEEVAEVADALFSAHREGRLFSFRSFPVNR
ncbi:acyl-CoA dehydrogenase family protein [Streptomyces sp. H27-S2]|uniref:acyl-CoA dehydrogenase family protein n=1 Tax=Streptomyces antarcticus TaxID=2996458 RepID=UPI00226F0960|nr:acyl-CoA dehydrogenase family protein [Streptomyces sp. H27-S2]MCY0954262.1 acyl-CoA dehydrogenase family protein [Streptomyces sp. H27-S2]